MLENAFADILETCKDFYQFNSVIFADCVDHSA